MRKYQKSYIEGFDSNMFNLMKCGEKLMNAFDEARAAFDGSVSELSRKLVIGDGTQILLLGVDGVRTKLRASKVQLDEIWSRFQGRKVDRATIEASLAA